MEDERQYDGRAAESAPIRRRRRSKVLIFSTSLVGLLLVALLVASTVRSTGQVPWQLVRVSDDGRTLVVRFPLSGCRDFSHFERSETRDTVSVSVFVSRTVTDAIRPDCPAEARYLLRDIVLTAPLADRFLIGCLAGGDTGGPSDFENESCRDTNRQI